MMQKEYIIAFSSFYKAAYAQDLLGEEGVKATLRKLPIEIAKSCSTGLYIKGDYIEFIKSIFDKNNIHSRGIYLIDREKDERTHYILIR